MPRRFVMVLALLSALTGCVGSPPSGPLVEYRDGLTPITRPVKCEAKYALRTDGAPDAPPVVERFAVEGQRIGFYRDEYGELFAVAPGWAQPLGPGGYRWEVVKKSVPSWRARVREHVRRDVDETQKFAREALVVTGTVLILVGLGALYILCQSNTGF